MKSCNQCKIVKEVEDFYIGSTFCKDCVKLNSKKRIEKLTSTPEGLEKERQRHRDKYYRLGYKEQQKVWNEGKPWKNSTVYKGLRSRYYLNLPREFELHHWNYNDEYLKDVFILNIRDHKNLHNYLILDIEKRLFYLKDGTYLDTKEKHENFIKSLGVEILEYSN